MVIFKTIKKPNTIKILLFLFNGIVKLYFFTFEPKN